ncbi:hypothetical protein DM02DRAFT_611598 [Periconia macrospinosa]|uniref:Uncharacterized protein n=1 Tax=Periconia macrospinosa TaxID=97972 RepID=A0A2V1E1P6_9PLEO|nr:hypothetical protein DM02DRAFT_611598 [Periconia macrospinosa]
MQKSENTRAELSGENPLPLGMCMSLLTVFGICLGVVAERSTTSVLISCALHFYCSTLFLFHFSDTIRSLWFPLSYEEEMGWKRWSCRPFAP